MKTKYLIILAVILFVIGCVQQPAATTPTAPTTTPAETTPTETTLTETVSSDIMIKDRVVTPIELTIPAGTEVSISVEGRTAHVMQVVKEATANIGPRIEQLGILKDGDKATYTFTEPGTYTLKSFKVGSVRVAVTVE